MRFALIGDHPDGLAMTAALVSDGRHSLAAYAGPAHGRDQLHEAGNDFRQFHDLEEILAEEAVELVIVADALEHRAAVLRRALQAEKHVLCVHPADLRPDICYEASMIVQDTRKVLLPLLGIHLSPGFDRLQTITKSPALGAVQLIEAEWTSRANDASWADSPILTAWDGMRRLGGEIHEVSTLNASGAALEASEQVTLNGRFSAGALFHLLINPLSGEASRPAGCRWLVRGDQGQAELQMPKGPFGRAELSYAALEGERHESFPPWNLWQRLVEILHGSLDRKPQPLSWVDETRCLELFDAARASARRRRVVPLDYEASSEEANFKSTMTALGCGLLLMLVVLFFAMPLVPGLKYIFLPLLVVFLLLQLFRWVVPSGNAEKTKS
jgi:predicted dehydrogenase